MERSLGKLMNESVFMSGNMHRPEELDFYVPLDSEEILENELSLLQSAGVVKRNAIPESRPESEDGTFFITVDAVHVKLTFWMGFVSLQQAQAFKDKL